jgi:hypothetical protein
MAKERSFFKIKVIFSLIVVIFLVFVTNRVDKKHFTQVQDTINTLFYDRIVAQDYLFKMDRILNDLNYQINLSELQPLADEAWNNSNTELDRLIDLYSETKLTKKEEATLDKFRANLEDLRIYGPELLNAPSEDLLNRVNNEFNQINGNISDLSTIQVEESKNLKVQAQKSLRDNAILSNIEIIALIGLGILFQLAIFFLGRNKDLKV